MSFGASDFLLSITDLFVILLPGFFLILFLALIFELWNQKKAVGAWQRIGAGKWILPLVVSFLLGHFISQFGAWGEDCYYRSNPSSIKKEYPALRKEAMRLVRSRYDLKDISEFNVRGWSARLIRIEDRNAADRIDRKDAERRLFRNMVIVFLVAMGLTIVNMVAHLWIKSPKSRWLRFWLCLVGFLLCLLLSYGRYHYQSDKYTKEVFEALIAISAVAK